MHAVLLADYLFNIADAWCKAMSELVRLRVRVIMMDSVLVVERTSCVMCTVAQLELRAHGMLWYTPCYTVICTLPHLTRCTVRSSCCFWTKSVRCH